MQITPSEIRQRFGHIDTLEIHSLEMNRYVARANCDGNDFELCRQLDRNLSFDSVEDVRMNLEGLPVDQAVLVQQCAYEEMIGQEQDAGPMRMPLVWAH